MQQQLRVRQVMRPPKGDNITLAQAKRAIRKVMREDAARGKAAERARAGSREAHRAEA
jgi:hypothetical protein